MANLSLQDSSNIKVVQNGLNVSLDFTTTGDIGDLTSLDTSDTSSLVSAINEVYNETFYNPGDTYSQSGFICPGHITGGSQSVVFTLPLPKSTTNITTASVDTLTGRIRGVGGYINGSSTVNYKSSSYTVSNSLKDNIISISIQASSALSGATNNTPIAFYIDSLSISFS